MEKEFFEILNNRVENYLCELNRFLQNPDWYLFVGNVYDFKGTINIFNWSRKSKGGIVEIVQGIDSYENYFGRNDLSIGNIHYVREEGNGKENNISEDREENYCELISLEINGDFCLKDSNGEKIDDSKRNYVLVNHVKVRKKSRIISGKNENVYFKSKGDVLAVNYKSSLVKGFRERIFSLEL